MFHSIGVVHWCVAKWKSFQKNTDGVMKALDQVSFSVLVARMSRIAVEIPSYLNSPMSVIGIGIPSISVR